MNKNTYDFILRRLSTILSVAIITLSLLAAVTGILLSFYYEPVSGGAYQALKWIDTEIPNGLLIHSIHDHAGNWLIGLSLIQIVVMFLGRQFRSSWLTAWISGILLTLTAIGLSWTAMLLDWSQVGYWRFRIELGTIEAIPFIGSALRDILTGGGSVNTTTVEHLYTIHSYLLSVGAIILATIHLWGLLQQEKQRNRELAGMPSTGELQGQPEQTETKLIKTP
jgi:cytochrome b6